MSKTEFMKNALKLSLQLVGGKNYEWIKEKRPQNLDPRRVIKVQSNAIYLEGSENNGKGSYLGIPVANLVEYDGDTLKIYDAGVREMNEEEKRNCQRADEERRRFQQENPYSDDFWHMKRFYKECSTPWIYTGLDKPVKGKKAAQGNDYGKIIDNAIKGTLVLEYKVISA